MKNNKTDKIDKPNTEEAINCLLKDYENNANRLRKIPEELVSLGKSKEYTEKDHDFKLRAIDFKKREMKLRMENFGVRDVRFNWEDNKEWLDLQKEVLHLELDKAEFEREIICTNFSSQLAELEERKNQVKQQRDRCIQAHKIAIKQLREECKMPEARIIELKKLCNEPCCR